MIDHTYRSWNPQRTSDSEEPVLMRRKCYFLCESRIARAYFKAMRKSKKEVGIDSQLDIVAYDGMGTGGVRPRRLLELSKQLKKDVGFDKECDEMVILFDGDVFERMESGYYENLIEEIEREEDTVAVVNPNFDLFLLLHIENAYEKYLKGCEDRFFTERTSTGKYDYAFELLKSTTGYDFRRRDVDMGVLAQNVLYAAEQEKMINQDVHDIKGKVTSNVGEIILSLVKGTEKNT